MYPVCWSQDLTPTHPLRLLFLLLEWTGFGSWPGWALSMYTDVGHVHYSSIYLRWEYTFVPVVGFGQPTLECLTKTVMNRPMTPVSNSVLMVEVLCL